MSGRMSVTTPATTTTTSHHHNVSYTPLTSVVTASESGGTSLDPHSAELVSAVDSSSARCYEDSDPGSSPTGKRSGGEGHGGGVGWCKIGDRLRGTAWLGAFNIICCVVGVGLLGLPYALSHSGWIGVPLLLVTCAAAAHTAVLLGDCLAACHSVRSFGDLGELAYGARGRWAVAVQQYMTMLGVASIYLIVLASGLKEVFPGSFTDCRGNIFASAALVSFHILFYKMDEVGFLSVWNMLVAILIAFIVCHESVTTAPTPRPPTRFLNLDSDGQYNYHFMIAFPTIAFAFGCHTILPALFDQLSDKKTFRPMCWGAIPVTLLLYLPVACVGYWAFGDQVQDPIFKHFTSQASKFVLVLLMLHVAMSYAILMNPPEIAFENTVVNALQRGSIVNERCKQLLGYRQLLRLVLRLFLTGVTALVAIAVPCFPVLLSLVSSITATSTSFVFPTLFYLKLVPKVSSRSRAICYAIIAFSTVGGVAGTYNAVLSMSSCTGSSAQC